MGSVEDVVAAVRQVCEAPELDRRGTYAHGQRVLAKRVLKAVDEALTPTPDVIVYDPALISTEDGSEVRGRRAGR